MDAKFYIKNLNNLPNGGNDSEQEQLIQDAGEIEITEPGIITAEQGKGFTKIDTTSLLDFIKYKISYDSIDRDRGIMYIDVNTHYPLPLSDIDGNFKLLQFYVEKIIIIPEYNRDNVIEYYLGGDFTIVNIQDLDLQIQNYTYDNVYTFIQNYHDNFPNSSLFYNSLVYIYHNSEDELPLGQQELDENYDYYYDILCNLNLLSDNALIYVLGDL